MSPYRIPFDAQEARRLARKQSRQRNRHTKFSWWKRILQEQFVSPLLEKFSLFG